uniref:Uncharacterized protein n=1 Tax=Mycena chlorophos TaxID=658473 RepID=A0ABQ0L4G7_MYCCL|nr:predicted protein [Mycena chlorophos]
MQPSIELLYTTHFPAHIRTLLEEALSRAGLEVSPIYDPDAFAGLSPGKLYEKRQYAFTYALVADERTLDEISSSSPSPTVVVLCVRHRTPIDEWGAYQGPDLQALSWGVRLALLRSMLEERFTLDQKASSTGSCEWIWEEPTYPYRYEARLFQLKWVRADVRGAMQACREYAAAESQYPVKDKAQIHAVFEAEAAKTDGVFTGLKQ